MEAEAKRRSLAGDDAMDTSVTVTGTRGRPPANVVEVLNGPTNIQDKRRRVDAPRSASAAEREVLGGHEIKAKRNPVKKSIVDATWPSVVGGVDAAVSAWVAEECNRRLGQESSKDEERSHVDVVGDGREKEHDARKQIKVSETQERRQHFQSCCGYHEGSHPEIGGWKKKCEGSYGSQRLPESGSRRWRLGHLRMCESSSSTLASHLLRSPRRMGDLEFGYRKCLFAIGWL